MGRGRNEYESVRPKRVPVGIYGWRKRCLYTLILFLMVIVIMNLALNIWILRVLDFSIDGMGRLRITKKGIRLEGEAEFLDSIYVDRINSKRGGSLYVESSKNITFHARNEDGEVTNEFVIGNSIIDSKGARFDIRDKSGEYMLKVKGKTAKLTTEEVVYTGKVEFQGSVTTPNIKSPPNEPLNIVSNQNQIKISGQKGVSIISPDGDVEVNSMKDLKIQATEQNIILDSKEVLLKNLEISVPRLDGTYYSDVNQVCMCPGGRLFLAQADKDCQATKEICEKSNNERTNNGTIYYP